MVRRVTLTIALLAACASQTFAARHTTDGQLADVPRQRAHAPLGSSGIITRTFDGRALDNSIASAKGKPARRVRLLAAQVAEPPDIALDSLADVPRVRAISLHRPAHGVMERTGATTGAGWVRETLGAGNIGRGTGCGARDCENIVREARRDPAIEPDRESIAWRDALPDARRRSTARYKAEEAGPSCVSRDPHRNVTMPRPSGGNR